MATVARFVDGESILPQTRTTPMEWVYGNGVSGPSAEDLSGSLVRYVNTASTAGGDGTTNDTVGATRAFASLSSALTALKQDLTGVVPTLRDEQNVESIALDVLCTGAAADTAAVSFGVSAYDNFSVAGPTPLETYSASWTKVTGMQGTVANVTGNQVVCATSEQMQVWLYNVVSPVTADYQVSGTIYLSNISSTSMFF